MPDRDTMERRAADLVGGMDALVRRFMFRPGREAPDEVPLTRREIEVLLAIGRGNPCGMGELAGRVMRAVSTLTAVADRLVRLSLLRREQDAGDRRRVRVALTTQGRRLYDHLRRRRLDLARGMLSALDDREQELFLSLIGKMAAPPLPESGSGRGGIAVRKAGGFRT